MRRQIFRSNIFRASLALFLGLLVGGRPVKIVADDLKLPVGLGLPQRREGGGTRGECLQAKQIASIVPKSRMGTTATGDPTFFVYLPSSKESWEDTLKGAEFGIEDENGNEVYQKILVLKNNSGIVDISLSDLPDAPTLEVGKIYKWYFHVICDLKNDPQDRSSPHFVGGGVQRIELREALKSQLAQVSDSERATIYAREGIWYETLKTMAQLRRDRPNDLELAANWASILASVGLADLAEEPLTGCCTLDDGDRAVSGSQSKFSRVQKH